MGVFASDASFSKIVQPASQEDSSATEALSTNGIHQVLRTTAPKCFSCRCICGWFRLALLPREALRQNRKTGNNCGRHAAVPPLVASWVVIQYDKWHLPAAQILEKFGIWPSRNQWKTRWFRRQLWMGETSHSIM